MKSIPGYEGLYSINENGEVFSHFLRRIRPSYVGTTGYAEIDLYKNDVRKKWRIHRLLGLVFLGMGMEDIIDHADGDITNNALTNLRVCDRSQNMWNGKIRRNNVSGSTGVWCDKKKKNKQWCAALMVRYKSHWLGYFETKEEAIQAHQKKKNELCGEFSPF